MKKILTNFYNYFFKINFYDILNYKLENLEIYTDKMMKLDFDEKLKSKQLIIDDKINPEIMDEIDNVQTEIIRLRKLSKEFSFEFNYSYGTSYLCTVILFCCLNFMLKNYFIDFLLPNYYTPFFISLNLFYFVFSLFVYKYWIKQTSIYYEQFI